MNSGIPANIKTTIAVCALYVAACPVWMLPALSDQPVQFKYRWESVPDLGVSWVFDPDKLPISIDLARLRSANREWCVDEARRISMHAANVRYGRQRADVLKELMEQLRSDEPNPQVRRALLSAAIQISDGQEADELWQLHKADTAVQFQVERALVKWKSNVAAPIWRDRIHASHVRAADMLIAIEGIAGCGDASDAQRLTEMLGNSDTSMPVRLAAARSVAELHSLGLDGLAIEKLARDLLDEQSDHAELLAAELLAGHSSPDIVPTLNEVLESSHGPAKAVAYVTLSRVDHAVASELAVELIGDEDSSIRLAAVEGMSNLNDTQSLRTLMIGLRDQSPVVRRSARKVMENRSGRDQVSRDVVDDIVSDVLTAGTPESIEQVIQLIVHLNDAKRVGRLFDLLGHASPKVRNAAAWALDSLLQASDAELIDAILQRAVQLTNRHFSGNEMSDPDSVEAAFLIEIVGRFRLEAADEALQQYIPKYAAPAVARAAAIWALGHIWEGKKNRPLVDKLAKRLHDYNPENPEDPEVKYTCAIAMAMIQHPSSLRQLDAYHRIPPEPTSLACEWAIEQFSRLESGSGK